VFFRAGHIYWIRYDYIHPIHEKISLCICPERPLFFWINSVSKIHGIGQVPLSPAVCSQLKHHSYLDLSGVKTGSEFEMETARDDGPMSDMMKTLVLLELSTPISLLPEVHRALALANLT
jgi:hypothetical protein